MKAGSATTKWRSRRNPLSPILRTEERRNSTRASSLQLNVRALDSTTLLAAWEQGASQPMLARALALLAAASPERSIAEWSMVTIGERDLELLRLRESM